ncbi:hypothetical protein RDI58_017654 [Solanum bulbocastanum]|uniref:Uncharacterized protein n=1 Tax=Solanum bulbocastanum TaxID=147425 RepID=A0AAN8TBP5_SOLBU
MTLVATVYYLWRERDFEHFHDKINPLDAIVKQIVQEVHFRKALKTHTYMVGEFQLLLNTKVAKHSQGYSDCMTHSIGSS